MSSLKQSKREMRDLLPCNNQFPVVLNAAFSFDECEEFVIVDTETTGLEPRNDEMIELGMVKVLIHRPTSTVVAITGVLSQFGDPGFELPEKITELTGLTNSILEGQMYDVNAITEFLKNDPTLIAHNAEFDKGFFEAAFPQQAKRRWVCSVKTPEWKSLGYPSRGLVSILETQGYSYAAHRATTDCAALINVFINEPTALEKLLAAESVVQAV